MAVNWLQDFCNCCHIVGAFCPLGKVGAEGHQNPCGLPNSFLPRNRVAPRLYPSPASHHSAVRSISNDTDNPHAFGRHFPEWSIGSGWPVLSRMKNRYRDRYCLLYTSPSPRDG